MVSFIECRTHDFWHQKGFATEYLNGTATKSFREQTYRLSRVLF